MKRAIVYLLTFLTAVIVITIWILILDKYSINFPVYWDLFIKTLIAGITWGASVKFYGKLFKKLNIQAINNIEETVLNESLKEDEGVQSDIELSKQEVVLTYVLYFLMAIVAIMMFYGIYTLL